MNVTEGDCPCGTCDRTRDLLCLISCKACLSKSHALIRLHFCNNAVKVQIDILARQ